MEFKKLIRERRSCRHFNSEPISEEVLLEILESGRVCQSAMNRQPWKVKIVKGVLKTKIAEILEKDQDEALSLNASFIRDCGTLLLIYTDKENETNVSNLISIGAFIEHLCLSAADNGLGSLWNRYLTRKSKEINELLEIEDKYLVSGVLLGYYDGELKVRPRKNLDEIIMK